MTSKMKYREKIGHNGEIRIPSDYMKTLALCPGEEVELRLAGRHLLIEPVKEAVTYKKKVIKDPVKELTGSLEIDPKLADAILEADYQPEEV